MGIPLVEYNSPSNGVIFNNSIEINVSITESNLKEINFNFEGTNYSIFNENLVVMYNFDNESLLGENGTHIFDVSGNNNNATTYHWTSICQGGTCPDLVSGKFGKAYYFDGTDDHIEIPSLHFNDSFSVSIWVKTTGGTTYSDNVVIADQNIISNNNKGFRISLGYSYSFIIGNGTANINAFSADAAGYNDGNWHHILGTFNKSSSYLVLYIDGEFQQANLGANGKPYNITGDITGDNNLTLGGSWRSGISLDYDFTGTLDELMIWNKSLTSDEVKHIYFSNIKKRDFENWTFYTDITKNYEAGDNSFFITAINLSGAENSSNQLSVDVQYSICKYYDCRKATMIWTGDDWNGNDTYHDAFMNASIAAQTYNLIFTPGIITGENPTYGYVKLDSSEWSEMQSMIDTGYVIPSSHSNSHDVDGIYADTYGEVCGSRNSILGNLTLPWQNSFNGSEFMAGWIRPGGAIGASPNWEMIRGNLSSCGYLIDREVIQASEASFIPIYATEFSGALPAMGLYRSQKPVTVENGSYASAGAGDLNFKFDSVYNSGGIYHIYTHPAGDHLNQWNNESYYLIQHLNYTGNRTDVWYVGFDQLYMYRYLKMQRSPIINVTSSNQDNLTIEIYGNSSARNDYGLSYPLTYVFSIPNNWTNAFVQFKNLSLEDWQGMEQKTRNDWWNGVDAYRNNLSGGKIYISKGLPQNNSELYFKIYTIYSDFTGTNISLLSSSDLSNLSNFYLENSNYGKINFTEGVNLIEVTDLNTYVNISNNYISIDSTALPVLNKTATLILYNLSFTNPQILRNGDVCSSSICTEVGYTSDGNFTFTVTSFSIYSSRETPTTTTPETSSPSSSPIYKIKQEEFEEGYSRTLKKNWKIEFEFENKTHIFNVDDVKNDSVVISVESDKQTFELGINETKKLNLNNDSFYDLEIFLKGIDYRGADLTLKSIYEEIPAEELKDKIKESVKDNLLWLWIILGLIVVIGVVVRIGFGKKKRKRK